MSDLMPAGLAVVMAMACIQQLMRLTMLAREFRCYAKGVDAGPDDLFRAIADRLTLDKHQRILSAEALVATCAFIALFCSLLAIVIISW